MDAWRSILAAISARGAGRGFVGIPELLVQEAQVVIQVLVEPSGSFKRVPLRWHRAGKVFPLRVS